MKTPFMYVALSACMLLNSQAIYAATHEQDRHEADMHVDVLVVNPHLSLHDVLEKTVARQPQLLSLQSKTFNVQAKETMAKSMLPHAPAISLYHQNDTIGSGRNERDWQAELELPVWLPKQRGAREKVAELSAHNLSADRESLSLHAAGLLRDAMWDIARNRNEVSLYSQKMTQAKRLEADISKAFSAGELAKTDLMLVQQDTLLAQKNLVRAEAELMHARFRYTLLTGLNEIPESFEEKQSDLDSFEQSSLWLAAESKVTLAHGERDLTQVEKRENMQVILNARSSQGAFDNQYNQSVGVRVRIPLDSAVRSTPLQAASELAVGEALSQRETLRFALEAAMHEAEHNLSVSKKELEIASQQLEIAKKSAELAQKAYTLGELDLTSLLRIQSQTFETERSYTNRQLQVKWDIARYNQAVGVLP